MLDDITLFFSDDDLSDWFELSRSDGTTKKILGYFDAEPQITDYGHAKEYDLLQSVLVPAKEYQPGNWQNIKLIKTGKTYMIRFAFPDNGDLELMRLYIHDS